MSFDVLKKQHICCYSNYCIRKELYNVNSINNFCESFLGWSFQTHAQGENHLMIYIAE